MFKVLFENGDFIAVSKPEGLATIAENDPSKPSVRAGLERAYGEKLYVVHRLDKDASGVLVFARHADAHRYLNDLFAERSIQKNYLALCHGVIKDSSGRIDQPIRQYGSGRMGVDELRGKASQTTYVVLKRYSANTLVEVHPLSGRRHQIRVHLFSVGHPVVGDLRYGERALQSPYPRLMLHAQRISFSLASGEGVVIEAPVPMSFQSVLDGLQAE